MKKDSVNEGLLGGLLKSVAIWWIFEFFGQLLINFQSYLDGRDYNITKAIKSILENLSSDNTFGAQIDDLIETEGKLNKSIIDKIMKLPKFQSQLNVYKNDKDIDFQTLKSEMRNVLIKSMNDQGLVNQVNNKLKNKLK